MKYQSAEDILAKIKPTDEEKAEAKEVAEIKEAISKARAAIHDAKARYIKQRLRNRSKKQAEEDPFEELKEWDSRKDIHDAFGWGVITEARMDRLFELWDAREESRRKGASTAFEDYVTRMLDTAWAAVGEEYADRIEGYEAKIKARHDEAARIARENNERTWRRENGETI